MIQTTSTLKQKGVTKNLYGHIAIGYRKAQHWFVAKHNKRPQLLGVLVVFSGGVAIAALGLFIYELSNQFSYQLTPADAQLIGSADAALMKSGHFAYSPKTKAYYLNKSDLNSSGNSFNSEAITVGNNSAKASYALKLPTALSQGVTVKDNTSGLSFSLTPEFSTSQGKDVSSHIVYPLTNTSGAEDIYTVKQDGLQEDVVLNQPTTNLKLTYKLSLPSYLAARSLPDGAIGIYSADPALFGNISYGDSADQLAVAKARVSSPKTYLVFALLPPIIRDSQTINANSTTAASGKSGSNSSNGNTSNSSSTSNDSTTNPAGTKTSLTLKGNTLTLVASNLNHLPTKAYPLDIDPSILVASASSFGATGNAEGDLNINTSSISEAGLTGGTLAGSTWSTATATLPVATQNASTVVYNGYVYEIGGANSGGTALQTVEYAQLNSNGSLNNVGVSCPTGWPIDSSNTWCVDTTSLPAITTASTATVYNGYIYLIGGHGGSPLATVEYAQPSSTGVLTTMSSCASSWTLSTNDQWCYDTSSLETADQNGALAVYNGYVYVIGGYNGGALQTVEYAQFSAVGALTTLASCATGWTLSTSSQWCYNSTSLPAASQTNTAVAYNGYLYEIGGVNSSALTTVDYTAINTANGSPGTWVDAGNDLLVATRSASSVVYDGYLYEIGGYVAGAASTNVEYAPLYANGTDGPWTYTSALPAATYTASAVQYNGNLIELGGENSSSTVITTIYAVAIEPAGYLSTNWTSTTAFTATSMPARKYFGSVAYNGYIYVLGGQASASSGDCTATSDLCKGVFYDSISSNGTLGSSWTATTSFTTTSMPARDNLTAVAYDGYMYVMGGVASASSGDCTATSDYCNGVFYAEINSNGTLGSSWTATTSFTTTSMPARDGLGAVAYNGYLYVLGGQSGASSGDCTSSGGTNTAPYGCNGTFYAPINSNGTLGSSWAATTSFTTTSMPARLSFGTVAYNGYLYVMGGQTTTSVGSGTTSGDCTTNDQSFNFYVCNGVFYAPINSNGTIGSWAATTTFPSSNPTMPARGSFSTIVYNGYLYVMGGVSGGTSSGDCTVAILTFAYVCNGVFYAPINSNGTIGSWTATITFTSTSMPARYGLGAATYNGYLYVMGGVAAASGGDCTATTDYCSGVFEVPINNGGPGTVGTWADVGNDLPNPTYSATSVVYQGYLYEIGGYNSSTLQNVEFAPINSNGTVGSWTYSTNLEQVTHGAASVAYDGYLYEIGGEDNSNNPYNTIEYAEFSSGGGLVTTLSSCPTGWTLYSGTWCYGNNNLPNATKLATAVAYNGYVYNIGGYTTAATNVVDYAQINANGSLGTWSDAGNDLPAATYKAASVIYNGYIYEIGGVNSSGNDVSTVEYAPINSNGTLGSWTVTTSLPIIMDYPETTAYDGYLYEVAGYNSSSAPVATVYYAPINTNGTIGSWTQTTNFSTALYDGDTLAYNGYLYQIGGANSSGTAEQTVDYTSLSSIPRVGDYSDLINLASSVSNPNGDVDPYEIIANGTNAGNQVTGGLSGPGGIVTQYAIADNTCTALSALQAINTGVSGQLGNAFKFAITTNGCSTATNLGSYLWLRYLLDDSQTATFPDVNGNHTTVNNFTVYFNPNSTYRLRDGATFDNGTLQSLDTEP